MRDRGRAARCELDRSDAGAALQQASSVVAGSHPLPPRRARSRRPRPSTPSGGRSCRGPASAAPRAAGAWPPRRQSTCSSWRPRRRRAENGGTRHHERRREPRRRREWLRQRRRRRQRPHAHAHGAHVDQVGGGRQRHRRPREDERVGAGGGRKRVRRRQRGVVRGERRARARHGAALRPHAPPRIIGRPQEERQADQLAAGRLHGNRRDAPRRAARCRRGPARRQTPDPLRRTLPTRFWYHTSGMSSTLSRRSPATRCWTPKALHTNRTIDVSGRGSGT